MLKHLVVATFILASLTSLADEDGDDTVESAPAQAGPAAPAPEVTELSEIVVTAYKDWCDADVLAKSVTKDEAIHANYLNLPGYKYSGEAVSKNPNFFDTLSRDMTGIFGVDKVAKKFRLSSGYYSCEKEKCEALTSKYADFGLKHATDAFLGSSTIIDYYALELELNFDEVYNAEQNDVRVSCPVATCTGLLIVRKSGYLFYTLTKKNGVEEKKLIVNSSINSKFVDGEGDEIAKCPPYSTGKALRKKRH